MRWREELRWKATGIVRLRWTRIESVDAVLYLSPLHAVVGSIGVCVYEARKTIREDLQRVALIQMALTCFKRVDTGIRSMRLVR